MTYGQRFRVRINPPMELYLRFEDTDTEMSYWVRKRMSRTRKRNRNSPTPRVISNLIKSLPNALATHTGEKRSAGWGVYRLSLETLDIVREGVVYCFEVFDDELEVSYVLWRRLQVPRVGRGDVMAVHQKNIYSEEKLLWT